MRIISSGCSVPSAFQSGTSSLKAMCVLSARAFWEALCAYTTASSSELLARRLAPCNPVPFFFQAEDDIRNGTVTGVQTCALPIYGRRGAAARSPKHQNCAAIGGRRLVLCPLLLFRILCD